MMFSTFIATPTFSDAEDRGLVVSLRNVNGRWDLLVSVGWCLLSGNPLECVGVMDLIQPLKTKEIESKLKVNWKKNMQNWSRFECGGARFFLWPTYHKYKNSWEHVWVKYGFWKRNKQINTYTSYHQTAHIKTVSRERKPINIPKTTSSLTLPESVWDGPSLPGHGLATPGFLGWQEKRKELVR